MLAATSLWLCRMFHGLAVWRSSARWLTLAQWPADTVRQSQRVRLRCRFSTLPQQQQTTLKQLGTTTTNNTGFYMPDPFTVTHTHARTHARTHAHTHTQSFNGPLSGWAGIRRNIHPLTPTRKKKKMHGSSSPLWCFEPVRVVRPN